ncbi:MAG: hydantoinase B/oxoprolinase family protein [Desulfosalsimonas sp.]
MTVNPVRLEIYKHRFSAIAEEMGAALKRTAFSPNIKERMDFSCAVFDRHGRMISQAAHIPVHLGAMPLSVKSAIEAGPMADGDMVLLNDPFRGGTHLPDLTLVAPVFADNDEPAFYVANRAHHADIGGMSAGSMPLSTSIFQEGLIIPPVKLVVKNKVNQELLDFILANVRTPEERQGDFNAQLMANRTGIRRIQEMTEAYGKSEAVSYGDYLIDYAENLVRTRISLIPDGKYAYEDVMEDDGCGRTDIRIKTIVEIKNNSAVIDFTESDAQATGSINAVAAVTWSAVLYVFRCLIEKDIPANAGCLEPVEIRTKKGTIVDAGFPAAVAAGNVETAQRIVDVLIGALAKAVPDSVCAAAQGTMNNITIGGIHPKTEKSYTYYETIGGGMGASAIGNGESAVHVHMTNTANTPIEALEYTYPFMVTAYGIRRDSGGAGKNRGGDGIVRKLKMLSPGEVTVLSERRTSRPYGLMGGLPGKAGENSLVRDGRTICLSGKFNENLSPGDEIHIKTPGGGGFGEKTD